METEHLHHPKKSSHPSAAMTPIPTHSTPLPLAPGTLSSAFLHLQITFACLGLHVNPYIEYVLFGSAHFGDTFLFCVAAAHCFLIGESYSIGGIQHNLASHYVLMNMGSFFQIFGCYE